jgi:hypothetical protein
MNNLKLLYLNSKIQTNEFLFPPKVKENSKYFLFENNFKSENPDLKLHKLGKIKNQGQDCFIITTLYELAYIENFQCMLNKTLKKKENETESDFQIRHLLQHQLKVIVEQIQDGKEVSNKLIDELRKSLVDIGFSPPLTRIQKILAWFFPNFVSYKAGDLFELYNTIIYQLDEEDYYIPTVTHNTDNFFRVYNQEPNSLVHLFLNNDEDMKGLLSGNILSSISKTSQVGLKINANWKNQKLRISPTLNCPERRFELVLVQCTVANKFMKFWNIGYHSMSFVKKGQQWYSCNDHLIKPITFDNMADYCAKGVLHLHYQPAEKNTY